MKIVYQNVIWLLFFAAYNYMSLADDQRPEVDVVGFFDEEKGQADIAFNTVIYNFDVTEGRVQYTAASHKVIDTDSFNNAKSLCSFVENLNVGGVICPTSRKTAPIIESICNNLEIPALQVNWRPYANSTNDNLVVNFHPHPSLLFQGLGVIVRNLKWRSIVILYENPENLIKLQDVLKIQNYDENIKYNTIIVKELGPGPNYRPVLKQVQNASEHRIILECRTENILNVLRQAKELKLLEKQFSYFFTSLDAHTLDFSVLDASANITTVRIIDLESQNFQGTLKLWKLYAMNHMIDIDLDTYSIKTETALIHDAVDMYTKALRDLHVSGTTITPKHLNCHEQYDKWDDGFSIAAFLKQRQCVDCASGPIEFDNFGRRVDFTIHVIEGHRGEKIAAWSPKEPNKLQFLKSEEDRNKELEMKWRTGGIVKVASILGDPYLFKKKDPPEGDPLVGNARYEGFSMDLIAALAGVLGIKYEFVVLKEKDRGKYDEDTKSWSGLIREILDRRADLAICDFTITPERREVVDFSTPFMRVGISILFRKPETKDADMYAFLDPLSLDLWIYSATLYLAVTVFYYLISRLSPEDWENPHPCDMEPEELENIWDMKYSLWLTLGSIMNQGCDMLPKGLASRMAASMWWFFAIIVTNSYTANLAAFLTIERSQNDINSAEDLARQTKVKYGTMTGGSTESFFRDSNFSTYQRMWTSMQTSKPSVFESSNEAGVARVNNAKKRDYAFLMESATLEYQIQTKCELMQVGNWLDSKSYGIAMPLDYPHRSRINEALLKLHENGRINQLKHKWWVKEQKSPICEKATEKGNSASLALQNVGGVFIVLGIGIALSYIVAIFEFLWNVRNLSVEEHISFKQAMKAELLFALNVRITKKKAKRQISESSSQSGESRSIAHSILRGAGSFLGLDVVSKADTPGTPGSSRQTSRPLE